MIRFLEKYGKSFGKNLFLAWHSCADEEYCSAFDKRITMHPWCVHRLSPYPNELND